jgi:hypothetical protein
MGACARIEARLVAAAFALAALLGAGGARAQRPELTLDWHAPAECPAEAELAARVGDLRGDRDATVSRARLDVRAFVTLELDGRFRAELRLVQSGSERVRVLEAPTCRGLAEASAAVIALAMSPEAAGAEPHAADAGPELAGPTSAPRSEEAPAAAPSRADRTPAPPAAVGPRAPHVWGIETAAGVATDFGAAANTPALGASAVGRVRYGEVLSFGLRLSFFPARASALPGEPNQGVSVYLLAGAPLACAAPFRLPVELGACVELELGYLHAQGFGPPIHPAKHAYWVAPGGGLTAAFPRTGRLRSRLSADALFPTKRTEFVLHDIGTPHRLPGVAPRVALYLELAFL